ncbi:high affinity cationic amino acid transporter 1 isoform X2 [Cylas formicarius]|nr:high affinity cationic amino acid transporter 1 isoform X2 [Cylas formicarius]XP_060529690.1 high affinity cationic amino acid transporter 1 isoform X2 [Cylas formicarius]XP_060529691.1 high affinity cationic amino acid transporter 1 isoform X2 [Cylas formicarius]
MGRNIFKVLTRRKTDSDESTSEMARCLNLVDLVGLGVGSTLGLGVYVLAGSVAKTVAGPAVCLSFLVAAVASAVAGLCYAEFASRVPKAGSAYVYSYVTVGEFAAFVIGWNLILEYVIGTASVARGLSNYIDALAGNHIRLGLRDFAPMDINFLSQYPDFLAFAFVILITALLSFGVKESSLLNNIFTVLNLLTVCIVLVSGSIKATTKYWNIPSSKVPIGYGTGGFFPYGISGVMAGAAKCFYGFVGFDAVATTGEEAKNPQRNIPLAIMISLLIIFAAYFGVSTVLTMMSPYFDQDSDAPFPYVFDKVGWPIIKWIVTSGAVFALCTSMLGAMFPLPRVIYAMAQDGIIFKPLAKVNAGTKTPIIATTLSGLLSGFMALIFDLDQLIDMMSIGTLMAYTIVAISVIILRYQVDEDKPHLQQHESSKHSNVYNGFIEIFNLNNNKEASTRTSRITNWSIIIYSIFTALLAAIIINATEPIFTEPFYFVGFVVSLGALFILLAVIARQPAVDPQLSFKVPLVPLIPCLSVFFNLYLMLELDLHTWIRFIAWLVIGLLIYFFYGIQNSEEGKKLRQPNKLQSLDPEKAAMRKEDTKL